MIDEYLDSDRPRADPDEGQGWRRLPFASVTEIDIDPEPNADSLADLLNSLSVGEPSDDPPAGWSEELDELASAHTGEAPESPIMLINGSAYLEVSSQSLEGAAMVWAEIDPDAEWADGYMAIDDVISVTARYDEGGDPPAVVSVGRTVNGAYVVVDTSDGYQELIDFLPADSSPSTIVAAVAGTNLGDAVGAAQIIDDLIDSGQTEYDADPSEGDEWIDQMAISVSICQELLDRLREE